MFENYGEETTAFAHESVTVDNTVGGVLLTSATYLVQQNEPTRRAVLTLEGAQIRYTYDATAPTTAVGHLMEVGDTVIISGYQNIQRFRAIRTGGVDGTLRVTYER